MKFKLLLIHSLLLFFTFQIFPVLAQNNGALIWLKSGNAFVQQEEGSIIKYTLPNREKQVILAKEKLTPAGQTSPLAFRSFAFSADEQKILLFTNTRKVWRLHTRGDYWIYNMANQTLQQVGTQQPASSLMFAQFSPDGTQVAYVSHNNIYVEDLATKTAKPLTTDGTRKLINGTFDWAYEEEFFCRNGFRWSPDGKRIAYWQMDANQVKDYLMVNFTDSVYSQVKPVEYPVAGETPSPYKIGVVEIANGQTTWMQLPGDPRQHYVPRMEWTTNPNQIILQQLNRKQNESRLFICQANTGQVKPIYQEKDAAWIDVLALWDPKYANGGWDWLNSGKEFLWASEKDGWRHLYRISSDGKKETLVTRGNYDVMEIVKIAEPQGFV
ncbi:MAG: DPP IV N-terminal domain-containing protein, partial [Bacteroidota bacterium]|nr:DPP IV N-terminal domain-containing protein [Bacteroidota bacterium]